MTAQADGAVIDLAHLKRQTMGDAALQREILKMFADQMQTKVSDLDAERPDLCDFAHGIKGSARGIGAVRVASAAERLERGEGDASVGIADLKREIDLALVEIGRLLSAAERP